MSHVFPVCGHRGKCQADDVCWLEGGDHGSFALSSLSTVSFTNMEEFFSCVNFTHLSRNIDSWLSRMHYVLTSYTWCHTFKWKNPTSPHTQTFWSINNNKGVKRFLVFARGLLYLSSKILSGEIWYSLLGNHFTPLSHSSTQTYGVSIAPSTPLAPPFPPSPTGREPSYQSPHYPNPLPAKDS